MERTNVSILVDEELDEQSLSFEQQRFITQRKQQANYWPGLVLLLWVIWAGLVFNAMTISPLLVSPGTQSAELEQASASVLLLAPVFFWLSTLLVAVLLSVCLLWRMVERRLLQIIDQLLKVPTDEHKDQDWRLQ